MTVGITCGAALAAIWLIEVVVFAVSYRRHLRENVEDVQG